MMADFTAKDVQALRQATGAGMMDAKQALVENGGDFDAAAKWLREKGLAKAAGRTRPREHRGRHRRRGRRQRRRPRRAQVRDRLRRQVRRLHRHRPGARRRRAARARARHA